MKKAKHIQMTKKEWRCLKRAQWKDALEQLKRFQFGCAYTPALRLFERLMVMADKITESISSKQWGH